MTANEIKTNSVTISLCRWLLLDGRRRGGGRIKTGYFPKYSPFDGCLNNAVAVCMPVVLQIIFFSLHFVTPWLLIQQKDTPFLWTALRWFPFSKNPVWNFGHFTCPIRDPRPDPSHRAFGYYSCKQDTKERYWGQQFCP